MSELIKYEHHYDYSTYGKELKRKFGIEYNTKKDGIPISNIHTHIKVLGEKLNGVDNVVKSYRDGDKIETISLNLKEIQLWARSLEITAKHFEAQIKKKQAKCDGLDLNLMSRMLNRDCIYYINSRFFQWKNTSQGTHYVWELINRMEKEMTQKQIALFFISCIANHHNLGRHWYSGKDKELVDKRTREGLEYRICRWGKQDLIKNINRALAGKTIKWTTNFSVDNWFKKEECDFVITQRTFANKLNWVLENRPKKDTPMIKDMVEKILKKNPHHK